MTKVTQSAQKDRQYWLLKSEPETFSFDDLMNAPNQTSHWDGVRNYQARNFMRDEMKKGDLAFFYHSGDEPGIVGIVEIVREGYPDHTAVDPKDPHYDPKDQGRRVALVDGGCTRDRAPPPANHPERDADEAGAPGHAAASEGESVVGPESRSR